MSDRRCTSCGTSKPASAFYPSVLWRCKDCLRAKALQKRDEKCAYLREWRRSNPDAHKDWYARNKDRKAEYWQQWYASNHERRAVSYAAWAKRNKGIVNALIAKRGAAKKSATVSWANSDAMKAIYAEAMRLTVETGIRHDVDHVYPLQSDWVCGLHCEANLQILTKVENIRKSNRRLAAAA